MRFSRDRTKDLARTYKKKEQMQTIENVRRNGRERKEEEESGKIAGMITHAWKKRSREDCESKRKRDGKGRRETGRREKEGSGFNLTEESHERSLEDEG